MQGKAMSQERSKDALRVAMIASFTAICTFAPDQILLSVVVLLAFYSFCTHQDE
jgi:hypothetical protein